MDKVIMKASEIIKERTASGAYKNQYCVLAQEDLDGRITAAVITAAKSDGIRGVTFCSGLGSNWAKRAERDSRAAVCFESDTYSITLRGRIEILTDAESKKKTGIRDLKTIFPAPTIRITAFYGLRLKYINYSSIGKKRRGVFKKNPE